MGVGMLVCGLPVGQQPQVQKARSQKWVAARLLEGVNLRTLVSASICGLFVPDFGDWEDCLQDLQMPSFSASVSSLS